MMRLTSSSAAFLGLCVGLASTAVAVDHGGRLYNENRNRGTFLEVSYQAIEKDILQETLVRTFKLEEGVSADVFPTQDTEDVPTTQKETHYVARLTLPVPERFTLHIEGGAVDADGSDGLGLLVGAGVGVLVHQWNSGLRLGVSGLGRWVSGIEYPETSVVDPDYSALMRRAVNGTHTREESYTDVALAITASIDFLVSRVLISPYLGSSASMLQGSGKETFEPEDENLAVWEDEDADFEQDQMLGVFGGLSVEFPVNLGLRVEGRFVDQTGFSAGLFRSF